MERENAERLIIEDVQGQVYQDELKLLSKGTQLTQLYRLNAFLDKNGVLRVGGRLCDSSLPNPVKHPAIIPKEHHITKMRIAHYHEKVKHQGKSLSFNEIRSNGYRIPGINSILSSSMCDL